jgi:hypothetical protein
MARAGNGVGDGGLLNAAAAGKVAYTGHDKAAGTLLTASPT